MKLEISITIATTTILMSQVTSIDGRGAAVWIMNTMIKCSARVSKTSSSGITNIITITSGERFFTISVYKFLGSYATLTSLGVGLQRCGDLSP